MSDVITLSKRVADLEDRNQKQIQTIQAYRDKIAHLEDALEKGQVNCDAEYDDLREKLAAAQAAGAEMRGWIERQEPHHHEDCPFRDGIPACNCGAYDNRSEFLNSATLGQGWISPEEAALKNATIEQRAAEANTAVALAKRLQEENAVLKSQVENADVNLEQVRLIEQENVTSLTKERDEAVAEFNATDRILSEAMANQKRLLAEIARKDAALEIALIKADCLTDSDKERINAALSSAAGQDPSKEVDVARDPFSYSKELRPFSEQQAAACPKSDWPAALPATARPKRATPDPKPAQQYRDLTPEKDIWREGDLVFDISREEFFQIGQYFIGALVNKGVAGRRPLPEVPEGWTLDPSGEWITRKGDGVWIVSDGAIVDSTGFGGWVKSVRMGMVSERGLLYRLPWPPKVEVEQPEQKPGASLWIEQPTEPGWYRGPNLGGEGTAGANQWWDGETLVVIVAGKDDSTSVAIVHVDADEGYIYFRNPEDDESFDFGPEEIAWWSKFPEVAQSGEGKEGN